MDKIRRAVKPHNVCPPETPAAVNHSAPQFIGSGPENPVVTIALKYPIAFLGQEHVTVELRRLKGRDFSRMRRLTAAGVSEDEAMLAIISGLPVEVIQELDGGNYLSLLEAAKGFIPARFRESGGGRAQFGEWPGYAGVVAHVLHFSHGALLEMEFEELIKTWFPVEVEINKTQGHQLVANLTRGFGG